MICIGETPRNRNNPTFFQKLSYELIISRSIANKPVRYNDQVVPTQTFQYTRSYRDYIKYYNVANYYTASMSALANFFWRMDQSKYQTFYPFRSCTYATTLLLPFTLKDVQCFEYGVLCMYILPIYKIKRKCRHHSQFFINS